mgnify:CR=1 FL=1
MEKDISLQIIANFIHQVINPIGGVVGTLDNICDGTTPPDKIKQRTNAARSQLEQVISLVRNLDFFVKLSIDSDFRYDGKTSKHCIIPQVLIESMQFYQEQALNRNILLNLLNREDQYFIHGNVDLLRQVFMNIFDNAVKYSKNQSNVNVRTWEQKKTNKLIIEFLSHSVPFDNSNSERLFELGYRADQAKEKTSSGSGIGLYICKSIIEKVFGGEIKMQYDNVNEIAKTLIYFKDYGKK